MSKQPIRIAFIGLSANAGWARTAHFPYLKDSPKYSIVAICNSSKEASEAAIKEYGLPPSTKAYGSPEELAHDADSFDLVVCSVRVDRHYDTVRTVVAKGKSCYIEWPLGKDRQEAEELYNLVVQSGNAKTMVGLQARRSPVVNKVRQLVREGAIGRVLSSTVVSSAGNLGQVEGERIGRIFNDRSIHCTMLNIHFSHLVDYVLYALEEDLSKLSAIVSTQRKTVQLKRADGSLVDVERQTPDQIVMQGYLKGGGLLSIHQRGGGPMKDTPGLRWRIYGETGEIEVTSAGTFLQIGYDDMTIRLHDHNRDDVQVVDWTPGDEFENLPLPARNVSRLYEAFAEGQVEEYADWKQAVARHRLLEKVIESSDTGSSVSL